MENNLYYTPTIEEFYVGFEFEANINNHWIRTQITDWYDGLEGEYRVKYLDQSDIESLGWEFNGTFYTIKNTWILRKFEDGLIIYKDYSNGTLTHPWMYDDSTDIIFEGWIKNLSELKKLMQQLNIK